MSFNMSTLSIYAFLSFFLHCSDYPEDHLWIIFQYLEFIDYSLSQRHYIWRRGGINPLFEIPHKKKSQGVKSGDLGGHSISRCKATTWLPKSSFRRSETLRALWQGAPSWNHQISWLYRISPIKLNSYKSFISSISCSSIIFKYCSALIFPSKK